MRTDACFATTVACSLAGSFFGPHPDIKMEKASASVKAAFITI
jgi:hypothetical protein